MLNGNINLVQFQEGTIKSTSVQSMRYTLNWTPRAGQGPHSPRLCRGSLQKWKAISRQWHFLKNSKNTWDWFLQLKNVQLTLMSLTVYMCTGPVLPAPFGDWVHIAKEAPRTPTSAVNSCMRAALHRSKPALSRMAKSPTCRWWHFSQQRND